MVKIGGEGNSNRHQPLKTLEEVTQEGNEMLQRGNDGKSIWNKVRCQLQFFKDNLFYKSCGMNDCRKKVLEQDGSYFCQKCGKNVDQVSLYLLNFNTIFLFCLF